jgi:hypothetical protein
MTVGVNVAVACTLPVVVEVAVTRGVAVRDPTVTTAVGVFLSLPADDPIGSQLPQPYHPVMQGSPKAKKIR